jgi:hypothetical protein
LEVPVPQALVLKARIAKNGDRSSKSEEKLRMTIKYADGREVGAVLLCRTDDTLRLAVEDVVEFSNVNGTWISADCEPVSVVYAWERLNRMPTISEAECSCSHELAARLLHLLFSGNDEDEVAVKATFDLERAFAAHV